MPVKLSSPGQLAVHGVHVFAPRREFKAVKLEKPGGSSAFSRVSLLEVYSDLTPKDFRSSRLASDNACPSIFGSERIIR
jgi:hypothetical protein